MSTKRNRRPLTNALFSESLLLAIDKKARLSNRFVCSQLHMSLCVVGFAGYAFKELTEVTSLFTDFELTLLQYIISAMF
jgi:hypothetical protein